MSTKNKWLTIGLTSVLVLLSLFYKDQVTASQCNINNEENCPIPSPICDNGEHVGNPHCVSPTPIQPTITLTPTSKPCNEDIDEEVPCPTITVVPTGTPTASPSPELTPEATATPSPTTAPEVTNTPSHADGRSDGLSSCPECTKAPNYPNSQFDNQPVGWK